MSCGGLSPFRIFPVSARLWYFQYRAVYLERDDIQDHCAEGAGRSPEGEAIPSPGPVIWISAPAGSGKTTLVASYLEARSLPRLWYKIDIGDADLSTFFYYLGIAGKELCRDKRGRPFPLLTPEYLGGIPAFTRGYFEELFHRLTPSRAAGKGKSFSDRRKAHAQQEGSGPQGRFALVFDNYQEVPSDSSFQDMVVHALQGIPEGVRVIVISRSGPPPQFTRLKANGRMSFLGWNELRFTMEEVRDAVKAVHRGRCLEIDCPAPEALYEKTDGWAAGLRLMIEATEPRRRIVRARSPGEAICHCVESLDWREDVFSYFACEVMISTEPAVRDFLLITSFLPFMTAAISEKLTGSADAAVILRDLSRRNFFTEWHPGPAPGYQFHPLFREFLQAEAISRYDPGEILRLRRTGAELLAEAGFEEEAIDILCALREFDRVMELILRIGRPLLAQGRRTTVERWISALSEASLAGRPDLLYIAGLCRLPVDPREARRLLENAFSVYLQRRDYATAIAVCGCILESIIYEADDFKVLDPYIGWLDGISMKRSPAIRDQLKKISGIFLFAVAQRKPGHPTLPSWLKRAEAALSDASDAIGTLKFCYYLVAYYLFRGEFNSITRVMHALTPWKKETEAVPSLRILYLLLEAFHAVFVMGEAEAGTALANGGLELARETGVAVYNFWLSYLIIAASVIKGDWHAGEACLQGLLIKGAEAPRKRAADLGSLAGHIAFEKGDYRGAVDFFQAAVNLGVRIGDRYVTVWYRICLAQAYWGLGDTGAAREVLAAAAGKSWAHSFMYRYQGLMTSAMLDLGAVAVERGIETLREALALGRKHNMLLPPFWSREMTASLLARALDAGIERDFVQRLIRKHRLSPPASAVPPPDAWPWPVKVRTLGRFEILREGRPLPFDGNVQRKPVEMLKAIIAFGGHDVPEELIMDALWPNADSEAARRAFKTALHRLRHGLGEEKYILLKNGCLSLSENHCRVDVIEFRNAAAAAEKGDDPAKERIAETALRYYGGPFLPEDEGLGWSGPMRERAKRSFIRLVGIVAGGLLEAGRYSDAARYYEDAVEADELDEGISISLMKCYALMRRKDKVAKTYRRYSDALRLRLDIGPSEEAQDLYERLMARKK